MEYTEANLLFWKWFKKYGNKKTIERYNINTSWKTRKIEILAILLLQCYLSIYLSLSIYISLSSFISICSYLYQSVLIHLSIYLCSYIFIYGGWWGEAPNDLDCDIIVSEFELRSCDYVHFRTNTLILPAIGLLVLHLLFYENSFVIK